jgi:hypothetical protein
MRLAMVPFPFNMFSPFSQAIDKFLYDPVTNWQGAFSPSIVFNANPQDAPIEAHVLSKTGSYGHQLGVLIAAVDVLASKLDGSGLSSEQVAAIKAFDTLRDDATKAADDFRGQVSADQILGLASAYKQGHAVGDIKALRDKLDELLTKPPLDGG